MKMNNNELKWLIDFFLFLSYTNTINLCLLINAFNETVLFIFYDFSIKNKEKIQFTRDKNDSK